jgi:predicted DNA-binding transcriptional regulator AlpA
MGSCTFAQLGDKIKKLNIIQSNNYYITANTTKRYRGRSENNLFSINNIVLDFDIHSRMNQHDREELIEDFIWYLKRDLFTTRDGTGIPMPNVVHYTGRGVQLWWHLQETSAKLDFLYKKVVGLMLDRIEECLEEYPQLQEAIEIDRVASKNIIGLYRLFDTYNSHTRTKTETEIVHADSTDLNTLFNLLTTTEQDTYETAAVAPEPPKESDTPKPVTKQKDRKKRSARPKNYAGLHRKRLFIIQSIVEQDGVDVGKRDIILFLAYNSAIQIMPVNEAKLVCKELNEQFATPLKSLEYIYKEFEDGVPYHFKNDTFYEWLGISQDSQIYFENAYTVYRETPKTEVRQHNKELRKNKKQQAKQMLLDGRSYKEIEEATGLSHSSIYRISAEIEKSIAPKPWDELGISRATYYRRMKQSNG